LTPFGFLTVVMEKNMAVVKLREREGERVTQRSFIDDGWWMMDGGYPFPDALH